MLISSLADIYLPTGYLWPMVAPRLAAASAALLAVLLVAAAPTSHAQAAAPSAFLGQLGAANTSSPVGTGMQLCCAWKLLPSMYKHA